jgi:hypothetical protein
MDEKLRIGDDGNVIGIIVLSQSDPLKATVELLDGDPLISRSQAKRVLARVELFRTVLFDFSRVSSIGQAFADEMFRVFAHTHPGIEQADGLQSSFGRSASWVPWGKMRSPPTTQRSRRQQDSTCPAVAQARRARVISTCGSANGRSLTQ